MGTGLDLSLFHETRDGAQRQGLWYWGAFVLRSPKSACLKSAFPCRSGCGFSQHFTGLPDLNPLSSRRLEVSPGIHIERSVRRFNAYFNRV